MDTTQFAEGQLESSQVLTTETHMEEFDTPYVALAARTLVDASDPEDIKEANALQDQMKIESVSARPYSHPNYDEDSYQSTYKALLELGRGISDTRRTFGKKEEVSEVRHLLATAWSWVLCGRHHPGRTSRS